MNKDSEKKEYRGSLITLIIVALAIVCLTLLPLVLLLTGFGFRHGSTDEGTCWENMKSLTTAFQMYAGDWDGYLPQANDWTDAIFLYTKSEHILHCPADKSKARSSYGFNTALSGKKIMDITNANQLVLLYETAQPGDNPHGKEWDVMKPGRHNGGNHFGFLDGHWKLLKEPANFTPVFTKQSQ